MDIIEKYNLKPGSLFKILGLTIAGLIVVMLFISIVKNGLLTLGVRSSAGVAQKSMMSAGSIGMNYGMAEADSAVPMAALSYRNAAPIAPGYNGSTGDTAESLEVTDYNASIETRNLQKTCAVIAGLKPLDYVIFENANEYDQGCNYYFKVKTDRKDEILDKIKELGPRELAENTRTIKKQIDDYTSQEDILKKQLAAVEETLNGALDDYDKLRILATQARDVESLAKIIDSKVNLIERLSQQRINLNSQLDRLGKAKVDELDKVAYTFFSVNVYENKFVDWKNIRDSWKAAVKGFVNDMNRILQDISINLVTVIFTIIQYVLYFLILLVTAKIIWQVAKKIWKGKEKTGITQ